jgi:selenocysteine lyase/cysteine desulfurase
VTSPARWSDEALRRARADTPGCEQVVHLNNAGASLMPEVVLRTVVEHLELEARIGGYEAAADAEERQEDVYRSVAQLLGCRPTEVALVENATRAWDMAFYGIPLRAGDRILTTRSEYASNYIALLQAAGRAGATVEVVPDDESGQISLDALAQALDERVRVVSLVHVPSQGGLVQPAEAVGRLCRAAGAIFVLDACQSAGQLPLDVERLGCDVLSGTGRKFLRGPRGTGFLYVRESRIDELEPPLLDLHAATWIDERTYVVRGDARRFENWESNVAGKLGLGRAIDYALGWGLDAIEERVVTLAAELRARLDDVEAVTVRDLGVERCGIVTFDVARLDARDVVASLRAQGVNVSLTPASYSRLDLEARGLAAVVRASVHYYNTVDELERLTACVATLARSGATP